jgi:magnesium transporter
MLAGGSDGVSYDAAALGVLLRDGLIVTASRERVAVVDDLARLVDRPERGPRFVLRLLDRSAAAFLFGLRAIDARVSVLEEQLQRSLRNAELHDLLGHQKALTHFHTALRSNEIMLDRLRRDPRFAFSPEDEELMDAVVIELQQAIEVTRVASEILGQMMDAFASIVSNNLNSVMKVLTSLTIILTLPTMIASFYGMNVGLPFAGASAAFAGVVVASVLLSLSVAALFWWRRWL